MRSSHDSARPLPDYLRKPPGPVGDPPPVQGSANALPYGDLDPKRFEYLILDYLREIRGWLDVQLYGDVGQQQDGIDLVDMAPSSNHPTCQVKRRKQFGPTALEGVVGMWHDAKPFGSNSFTVALSRKLSSASQKELIRLRSVYPSARLDVIDAGSLNRDLRTHPQIVRRHFHPAWVTAFCDPTAISDSEQADFRRSYLIQERESSMHRERSRLLAAGVAEKSLDEVISIADTRYESSDLNLLSEEFVVIEGPAGSGKSALIERIFRSRIELAHENRNEPLPIFFHARSIPGDLRTALRADDDPLSGRSLHIDGLDEVSSTRAHELVAQVQSLVSLGRISHATFTRRRRRRDEAGRPVHTVAELSDDESVRLMSAVAGRDVPLHSIPAGPARKAVHLPLFAIIAGLLRSEHRAIPTSRAQFLVALAKSEVERAEQDESLWEELSSLAATTVSQSGRVSRSEAGKPPQVATLLGSRFLEEEAGAIRFSLPLLEEFFAAQALIHDQALVDAALSSETEFEKWRGPLGIALALMTWSAVSHVIGRAAKSLPGAVWKLASSSFSGASNPDVALPLPSDSESEDRIGQSLSNVLRALGPASEHTALVDGNGDALPVGVVTGGGRMSLAVWTPGSLRPPTKQTIHAGWHGPSDWSFEQVQPAYFAEQVWPIATAIDLIDRGLTPLLESGGFAVSDQHAAWPERRYEISRILADNASLITAPIAKVEIVDALTPLREAEGLRGLINYMYVSDRNRARRRLLIWEEELRQYLDEFDSTESAEIPGPWTPPDQLHGSGWTWGLWSEEAWLRLIEEVYECALASYGDVVDRWFAPLKPFLGIGAMWPVELRVKVGFMGEASGKPGCPVMTGRFVPLQPGTKPRVTFTDEGFRFLGDWSPPEEERDLMEEFHPGGSAWSRWMGSFQSADIGCTGSAPALEIAYNWLIADLAALGVLGTSLTRQRRH